MRGRLFILVVLLAGAAVSATPASAEHGGRHWQGHAYRIAEGTLVDGSAAEVSYFVNGPPAPALPSESRVDFSITTSDLEPGHAYTIWLMVFNHAENCTNPIPERGTQCGAGDIFNPATFVSVMWGTGGVASDTGEASFAGSRHQGDLDRVVLGPGLMSTATAEVHLIVRDHGEYDPDTYGDRQTQTFNGGCGGPEPLDNTLPPLCTDVQTTGA